MTEQELIYEITKAIYSRLGPSADQSAVEGLVAEVYKAVRPALASGAASEAAGPPASPDAGRSRERAIVSVFGLDRPGILSGVASVLTELDCSVVDIDQTVVAGKFAMVMIVDMGRSTAGAAELKSRLREEGSRLGVNIYAQREDIFYAMHRV
jgi:ACT domain-containing protein